MPNNIPDSLQIRIDQLIITAEDATKVGQPNEGLNASIQAFELAESQQYPEGMGNALLAKGRALVELVRLDEAMAVLNQAATLFQENGHALGIARALQGIGTIHHLSGRFLDALEEYHNAFSVFELAGLEMHTLGVLGNISLVYKTLGEYFFSIEYARKRLTLAKEYRKDSDILKALDSLGVTYFQLSDFETSLEYSNEGLTLAIQSANPEAESEFLFNIGIIYYHLHNSTTALDYAMRSMAIVEQLKLERLLAVKYNFICNIYLKMNNDALALHYAMRALELNTEYGNPLGEADTLHNIASIFEHNGDYATALEYGLRSYGFYTTASVKECESQSLLLIARCKKHLNDPTAVASAREALAIAKSIHSHHLHQSSLELLCELSAGNGDTNSASEYSEALKTLSTLVEKEKQRKGAEKILLESQRQKTLQQAQLLIGKANVPLARDLASTSNPIKQQGFALASTSSPDPLSRSPRTDSIHVQTFGRFAVTINNREITTEAWQRKKSRDIFKILLIHHRNSVTIDELVEYLWANSVTNNLTSTLWNSVSYIRKALEPDIKPHTPSSYIKIIDKSYILDLGTESTIDFVSFKELISGSRKEVSIDNKITLLEQATALYTGDFLKEDLLEDWASYTRETLKDLYITAVEEMGALHLGQNNTHQAIACARKILGTDMLHENAYCLLFKALIASGNFSELAKSWEHCQIIYKRELLSRPPKTLADLASAL